MCKSLWNALIVCHWHIIISIPSIMCCLWCISYTTPYRYLYFCRLALDHLKEIIKWITILNCIVISIITDNSENLSKRLFWRMRNIQTFISTMNDDISIWKYIHHQHYQKIIRSMWSNSAQRTRSIQKRVWWGNIQLALKMKHAQK